ncbi:MAG: NfeD family protein [Bacillota bacterium]|nr:NfeD family protein [Bacillota bacterium]MDD3298831.1 NfeD family protein [Bacillota bacterium]MDD3850375.1 NfeD family protein [Bacillota bacterium]MDD4708083.1 NfeD family protein [Bacillota bacterium]
MRLSRTFAAIFLVFVLMTALTPLAGQAAAQSDTVYYIPVKGEINPAIASFISSELDTAYKEGASAVVLEISTLGGRVNSALDISEDIIASGIPTIAYIKDKAISAGVLIAISAEKVVMAPGSSIGSAETIPYNEKNISFWTGELKKVAELRERDIEVIAAMADRDIEIPDLVDKGKLLNLSTAKAVELGIADTTVSSRQELNQWLGLGSARTVVAEENYQIKLAKLVSSTTVSAILLTLGLGGIIAELFIPGFGLPGTVGLLSFGLFFAGSMLAGYAGWSAVILFVVGIILLLVELVVPGFGFPGIGGILSIFASIFMASVSAAQAVVSLTTAIVLSIILTVLLFKYAPRSKYFDRLILSTQLKTEEGYVGMGDHSSIVGREGTAVTPLRPAGTADIDGQRMDVVTMGDYIKVGESIKVLRVEGNRIIVTKNG